MDELSQAFNSMADDLLYPPQSPMAPKAAVERQVVTVRNWGFREVPFGADTSTPADEDQPVSSVTPPSCCFYPSPSEGLFPDWPATDAPSVVYQGSLALYLGTGDHYVDYWTGEGSTGNNYFFFDSLVHGTWEYADEAHGIAGYGVCMFGLYQDPDFTPPVMFDSFPNTLTVDGSITLTRTVATVTGITQGSCQWNGGGYFLDYGITTALFYTLTVPGGGQYTLSGSQVAPNGTGIGTYGPHSVT